MLRAVAIITGPADIVVLPIVTFKLGSLGGVVGRFFICAGETFGRILRRAQGSEWCVPELI